MLVFKREISSGTVTTIELFDKKRQLERVDLRHANAHSQSKSHADRAFKGGECGDVPIEFEDRDRVLILSNHDQGNSHKNVSKAERNAGDLNSNNLFNLITTTVFIKAVSLPVTVYSFYNTVSSCVATLHRPSESFHAQGAAEETEGRFLPLKHSTEDFS